MSFDGRVLSLQLLESSSAGKGKVVLVIEPLAWYNKYPRLGATVTVKEEEEDETE